MPSAPPLRITCPACGLARAFPAERAPGRLPHHCPRCGADVVAEGLLVEEAPPPAPPGPGEPPPPPFTPESVHRGGRLALLAVPALWEAAALAAFAALLAWSHWTHGFLASTVAGADLVFHEAGHPIFGLLGSRFLTILGGTLAQLAFPVLAALSFARAGRMGPLSAAIVWLGFNLVEVGAYAADAQARALPLLAPDLDSHDWWNMLGMLGVREHCRGIGGTIAGAGWLLWLGTPAAALWAAWRGSRPST